MVDKYGKIPVLTVIIEDEENEKEGVVGYNSYKKMMVIMTNH